MRAKSILLLTLTVRNVAIPLATRLTFNLIVASELPANITHKVACRAEQVALTTLHAQVGRQVNIQSGTLDQLTAWEITAPALVQLTRCVCVTVNAVAVLTRSCTL